MSFLLFRLATSSGSPIAFNTCEGVASPVLHADALEQQIPCSASNNTTVPPLIPSIEMLAFPGNLLYECPFNFTNGILLCTSLI